MSEPTGPAKTSAVARAGRGRGAARTSRRRLFADRAARWLVSAGGIAVIASVLGILVFIVLEVLPLVYPARVGAARRLVIPGAGTIEAVVTDEHRSHVAALDDGGILRVVRVADGKVLSATDLLAAGPPLRPVAGSTAPAGPAPVAASPANMRSAGVPPHSRTLAAATSDGRVLVKSMEFTVSFEGQRRVVTPDETPPVSLELDPGRQPLGAFAAQRGEEGIAAAAVLTGGRVAVARLVREVNPISGETSETLSRAEVEAPGTVQALVIDPDQRNLYAGTREGEVLWWPLQDGQPGALLRARAGAPVTALTLLLGARSLVIGQADGALSVWFAVRGDDGSKRLQRIRDFPPLPGPVTLIAPSERHKGFLAQGGGRLGLYYSTSHRTLWTGPSPVSAAAALAYAPKADAALVAGDGVAELPIRNPHPEVSLQALVGKVWYEGYEKPERVWQSTGGTDDFESKLSLTPLMAGTLKGTFYSLLLAIPLGVLGAMYTSQFMHPTYKAVVKPVIEVMASLPSVVLGFLAGLWLAPRVEKAMPGLILMVVALPALVLLAGSLWNKLPRGFRGRFHAGTEAFVLVAVLGAGVWLCLELSRSFERLAFGGDFQSWLRVTTGLPFDQRNAVVVGLAMGFAVIPIIFAISEDAFSNVPRSLIAGSLALGADRWQTVTRVVLPSASPGIFSAIMIGFGRAVGETMIVLMATGNTPISSWNPFNGFRTLSANIAVEIPEAPHAGTLYRVLFLAGLLLFIVTFIVNTAAELVRQRLRERYAHQG
jgi:phosphate transport system permease protein